MEDINGGWNGRLPHVNEYFLEWQIKLGLQGWEITTKEILDAQVTYPDDLRGEDRSFVGISIKPPKATIYHSRELTEEDIIHELLHIKYPYRSADFKTWDDYEDWVGEETWELYETS